MSNTAHNNSGKGRVVTSAPKSAKGKSAKSKAVGVPTRKTAKGHAQAIAEARATASKAGHKLPYENTVLDTALAKADAMPNSLTSAKLYKGTGRMPSTAEAGKARREWCAKVRAPKVSIADILHENKVERDGGSLSDRSEVLVRQRVMTRGRLLANDENRYYAVRSEPVTGSVDDQPMVYIVRR